MYQGQRRIPVQQARRVVGRKMFAGRSSYIPLRLNNAGVISIIFAISILLLPQQALVVVRRRRRETGMAATISSDHPDSTSGRRRSSTTWSTSCWS